jgi:hypothetical protein
VSRWMGQYPKSNGCSCQFGLVEILSWWDCDHCWSMKHQIQLLVPCLTSHGDIMDAGMESSNPVRLTNPLGLVMMALR